MKRHHIGVALGLTAVLGAACAVDKEADDAALLAPAGENAAVTPSGGRTAAEVLGAVRAHVARAERAADARGGDSIAALPSLARFESATTFEPAGDWLLPSAALAEDRGAEARVDVRLPKLASGVFRLEERKTGMAVEVRLLGAAEAPGDAAEGMVVYRGGYAGGADVLHRAGPEGHEDFVYFHGALPPSAELRYEIRIGEGVAGLRLVRNVLELLDAGGAPWK
jgi:hypothetical protein